MTISAVVPDIAFAGSGSPGTMGPFSLVKSGTPLVFYANSEVIVLRYDSVTDTTPTLLTEGTHYTLTGGPTAGVVTLTSPSTGLLTAERLYVTTLSALAQSLDLVNGGNFSSANLERRLDVIFQILQQHAREIKSTIRFAMFDTDEIPGTAPLGRVIDRLTYISGTAANPILEFIDVNSLGATANLTESQLADIAVIVADLTGADTIGIVATAFDTIGVDALADVAANIGDVELVADALNDGGLAVTKDTYAALTAIPAASRSNDTLVYVAGRAAVGDGGEGYFRFSSVSVATANGGTILAPDAGTGRWLRLRKKGDAANSLWFCTPDGVTTQTTQVQAFLSLGGKLWLEEGTYICGGLTVPAGTTLEGPETAILRQLTSSGTFINASVDNVTVRGITVDGNLTADTVAGGYLANHFGLYVVGTAGANINDLVIDNCTVKNFGDSGIYTKFVRNQTIRDNTVTRCGYGGIFTLSPYDAWILDNYVTNIFPGDGSQNAYGITATSSGSDRVAQNVQIDNNIIEDVPGWEGIDLHFAKNSQATGNVIRNCAQGIAFEGDKAGSPGEDILIADNTIRGWSGATFVKDGRTHYKTGGIVAKGAASNELGLGLSITGNTITEMGDTRLSPGGGAIFLTAWDGFTVTGNVIRNAYRTGITLTANGTGAMTNGIISGNTIRTVTAVSGTSIGIEASSNVNGRAEGNIIIGATTEFSQPVGIGQIQFIKSRERLFAARTYYVRTDGSDSNSGLGNSSTGAFLTITKALAVAEALEPNGYDVTILIGTGTWTTPLIAAGFPGPGRIILLGDETTPANVTISTTSADCFNATDIFGKYALRGLRLQTTTSGECIEARGLGVHVEFQACAFHTCASHHITMQEGAYVEATGNYSITGGATAHINMVGGVCAVQNRTVTITGTPAFSTAFAVVARTGLLNINGNTFSGSATGVYYSVLLNGVIFTNGGGATYLPGNSGGSSATGGQYA
jgi:hypothetical protein